MVRKLPLSSVFYTINTASRDTPQSSSSPPPAPAAPPAWMWPSCKHPRAHSFRSTSAAATAATAKTIASIFLDSGGESSFANSSARMMVHGHDCAASDSLSTESEAASAGDMADAIVRGLRSDRLRFEPRAPSSSILDKKKPAVRRGDADAASFGGGVAVVFDSEDPYEDFRASMAEMVAAHGGAVGDWDWLEAMLGWYLRANGKETHAAIVTAFVDLVVSMAARGSRSSSSSSFRHSSFTLAGTTDMESSSGRAAAGGGGHISFRLR